MRYYPKPRRGQARPKVAPIIDEAVRLLDGADRRMLLFKPEVATAETGHRNPCANLDQLMPRESIKAKTERNVAIIDGLKQTYPDARCELDYTNPLELLIATILSAQCTDKQVNIVTADLFKKYRCAAAYTAVPLESLQEDIKRIGLFRNKAKSIQNRCRALIDNHDGNVPADMKALVALAGVGRKTANVVLGNAFNINEGVVVDTHVARLSALGLAFRKDGGKGRGRAAKTGAEG